MLSLLEFVLKKKVRENRKIDFGKGLYAHAQSRGADKKTESWQKSTKIYCLMVK